MRERWTRDQKIAAASVVVGVIGASASFAKPIADALGPLYSVIQPFLFLIIGAFIGFSLTRMLDNRQKASAIESAVAEKQAVIDRLMNRREYARMTFRGLSYAELEKVREIAQAKSAPYMSLSDAAVAGLIKSGVLEVADDSTYVPPDSFQVRLKGSFRSLALEFSDVLDEVIKEIEDMGR